MKGWQVGVPQESHASETGWWREGGFQGRPCWGPPDNGRPDAPLLLTPVAQTLRTPGCYTAASCALETLGTEHAAPAAVLASSCQDLLLLSPPAPLLGGQYELSLQNPGAQPGRFPRRDGGGLQKSTF